MLRVQDGGHEEESHHRCQSQSVLREVDAHRGGTSTGPPPGGAAVEGRRLQDWTLLQLAVGSLAQDRPQLAFVLFGTERLATGPIRDRGTARRYQSEHRSDDPSQDQLLAEGSFVGAQVPELAQFQL